MSEYSRRLSAFPPLGALLSLALWLAIFAAPKLAAALAIAVFTVALIRYVNWRIATDRIVDAVGATTVAGVRF